MANSTAAGTLLALDRSVAIAPQPSAVVPAVRVPPRAVVGAIERAVLPAQIRQRLSPSSDDTSDDQTHESSGSSKQDATRSRPSRDKKRKPTYYMRKEEMAELQQEMAALRATLSKLQSGQLCGGELSLAQSLAKNAGLHSCIRQGDQAVARAQSLIASYGHQRHTPPIGGYIHLPTDPSDRERILYSLKMPRMHEAIAYVLARTQFLDLSKTVRQIETFETASGDFVTTHWENTPLDDAPSVQRAYQELLYFLETQEISMSEKIGVLTIRESDSEPIDGAQTVRMVSSHDNGLQVETNLAVFTQYFDHSQFLSQPHALMVSDYIDQDDLFPRQPENRIQKDVSAVTLITQVPGTQPSGPPLVTMVQWGFVRVNNTMYTRRRDLEYVARGGVGKWCDVMLKCIRERMAWPT